jgi:sodium/proline symporter
VAVAVIAFFIAADRDSSIFGLVSYAWAGFGAAFGPLVLLSLFWKGTTRNGALAGLIAGGVTVIVWKQLQTGADGVMRGGIWSLYEIVPGFAACLVLAVVVSLLDAPNNPEVVAEYEAYEKLGD